MEKLNGNYYKTQKKHGIEVHGYTEETWNEENAKNGEDNRQTTPLYTIRGCIRIMLNRFKNGRRKVNLLIIVHLDDLLV
jgi:hypothetical protein